MTFFEATGKCYRKYFVFSGRASKSEYWWFVLLTFLFVWPLLLTGFESGFIYSLLSMIYWLLTVSTLIPGAAVWTRRMHDINRSGWSWVYIFIPIVGAFMILRWLRKKGTEGPNQYGDPDNSPFKTSLKPVSEVAK
mgnify:CR=1 FL=1